MNMHFFSLSVKACLGFFRNMSIDDTDKYINMIDLGFIFKPGLIHKVYYFSQLLLETYSEYKLCINSLPQKYLGNFLPWSMHLAISTIVLFFRSTTHY